ncbi:unnamed protein product [Closterium sp. NIES-53]
MPSLSVLTFDHEGHQIQLDTCLDDTWFVYLLSDSRDSVSLFDHTSGASLAPAATANTATCSQWLRHDAATRLAVRNHLPLAERAHFGQHKTAEALYDAVVARYSSPATTALGRLILAYLFPELSAFATIEGLVTHLRTNDARYRAALPAEFLDRNLPPMYITLYFIVTRLPDSLRAVRDHFLALDPTNLTGCSPSPLAPFYTSAAAVDVLGAEDVGATSASGKRHSSKGKGGMSGGSGNGGGGGAGSGGGEGSGGGGSGGSDGRGGGGGGGTGGGGGSGGSGSGGSRVGAGQRGGSCGGQRQQQHRRRETPSPQQLHDAWRAEFGDDNECPRWAELLRCGVDIFALDYDAILAAMYALSASAESDCYLCVPPSPGIEAAALGASASVLPGTAPAEALHTFTLESGASRCFFRDSTTLTPLSTCLPVRLADPLRGPVLACSSTVLPCLAVPSGSLSGLHLPSFSTNLVSTAALQDAMVTTTTPGASLGSYVSPGVRVRFGSTPLLVSPPVAPDSPVAPPPWSPFPATPSWHALLPPCFWSSQVSASPPSLACPALPSLRRGAAARRSSLLLVSPDDFSPVDSPHRLRLQLRERFREDLPVLRLHSDKGGEFSSDLLRDFFRGEGILHSFTLLASMQKNGIAERRIGLVMEVAQLLPILNLWPRVSLPETSPTLHWTGKVGNESMFRVWGSRAFVRDTSTDMLSSRAIPCVFLGFPRDAPSWQFYHSTSRRVLPSQDVTFDKSIPSYRLFPYRSAPLPRPPLFLAPGPPPTQVLLEVLRLGVLHLGVMSPRVRSLGGAEPASAEPGGAEPAGVEPGGAESKGAEPGGLEPEGAEPGGAESEGAESRGAESGGAEPRGAGAASPGGARTRGTGVAGAGGVGGAGAGGTGAGGAGARGAGARDPGTGGIGASGAGAGGAAAVDPGAGGAGAGGAASGGTGAGGTVQWRPFFIPPLLTSLPPPNSVLRQVLSLPHHSLESFASRSACALGLSLLRWHLGSPRLLLDLLRSAASAAASAARAAVLTS